MEAYKHDGIGGYDKDVVSKFNKVSEHFDMVELLDIILSNWADDDDIISITEYLKDRLYENKYLCQNCGAVDEVTYCEDRDVDLCNDCK